MKHLEDVLELCLLGSMGPKGWEFDGASGSMLEDPLHPGVKTLRELYERVEPGFAGRVTVPMLWDKKTETIVNNESSEIIRMLSSEFDALLHEAYREAQRPGGGFYPEGLRAEIDGINEWVYNTVNNGVYKTGFANTQSAYEENVTGVFASLDRLEAIRRGLPFGIHVQPQEHPPRLPAPAPVAPPSVLGPRRADQRRLLPDHAAVHRRLCRGLCQSPKAHRHTRQRPHCLQGPSRQDRGPDRGGKVVRQLMVYPADPLERQNPRGSGAAA
jgi:hypothetical protein